MLSVHLIERHFDAKRYDSLLTGLASNDLIASLPLEARLSLTPIPAVALALRRLLELTYGPTTASRRMTDFLLHQQLPDGSFGPGDKPDPLATACAAAALDMVEREHGPVADPLVPHARDRALAALADMQSQDPDHPGFAHPDDRTTQDRDLSTAFILALLAGNDTFRGSVRFAEMLDDLDERQDQLDRATQHLWLLARMDTPSPRHTPNLVAA